MLRPRTLHLVVERLVDLDVQITLQQRSLEEAVEEEADAIFEVELGDATVEEVTRMRKNAEKLDEVRARAAPLVHVSRSPIPAHCTAAAPLLWHGDRLRPLCSPLPCSPGPARSPCARWCVVVTPQPTPSRAVRPRR